MSNQCSDYSSFEEEVVFNDKNALFYENIPVNVIKDLAIKSGLNTCCDVKLIQQYIDNAHSVLEVGAGYGRVVQHLVKQNCQANITVVERSRNLSQILFAEYDKRISIINADFRNDVIDEKFDLILWLWSGISDFANGEQELVLAKLYSLLEENGIIILDTLVCDQIPFDSEMITEKHCCLEIEHNQFFGYMPCQAEIDVYATKIHFKTVRHISYETTTNRKRILHVLVK